jgi:hypothetical protein
LFESFNTPGNEVAPGSDIVGEYLQQDSVLLAHLFSSPFNKVQRPAIGQQHIIKLVVVGFEFRV